MNHGKRHGFTLVELLVVIGIIGLLISILLPTMTRARAEAKRAVCLSNLRTLGQCYLEYVQENKGKGLFYYYSVTPPAGSTAANSYWFAGYTAAGGVYTWDIKNGYLAKYFKSGSFLTCPATAEYKSFSTTLALWASSPLTSYAYNGNLVLSPQPRLSSSASIKNASETCALIDSATIPNDATGTLTGVLASTAPYLSAYGIVNNNTPTFHGRHVGKGNVLWYDGHASSETPYVTAMAANLQAGSGSATPAGMANILRSRLGYLTPYNGPEATMFENFSAGTNSISYYYWADKNKRQ